MEIKMCKFSFAIIISLICLLTVLNQCVVGYSNVGENNLRLPEYNNIADNSNRRSLVVADDSNLLARVDKNHANNMNSILGDDSSEKVHTKHSRRHSPGDVLKRFTDLPEWIDKEFFILTDYLTDGELERRISFKGLTAKETSISYNSSKSLSLWQLSNGIGFIQLIISSDNDLIDCEYIRQKHLIHSFLEKFYSVVDSARSKNYTSQFMKRNRMPLTTDREFRRYIDEDIIPEDYYDLPEAGISRLEDFELRNITYQRIESYADIPDDIKPWLNFNELKMKCHQRHRQMKRLVQGMNSQDETTKKAATEHLQRKKRDISKWLIAPNTKWCGRGQHAGQYNQLGGASRADKCCRKHDYCRLSITALSTKWQLFNYTPFTISHCRCDRRHRRDLSNLLRLPGTKWCGKGWTASKYSDMGGYSKADRCCRQHDKSCPYWIMGFETKYSLFNWRVSTLMHCKCDERFRTCLKMADSSDANMVGKVFFNVIQSKCFVLKPEKVCKKRSWWGKCEKRVIRKRAHLRDNRRF